MSEYASICLNKHRSECAKALNIPDIVHSLGSLCEVLSTYLDRGVLRTFSDN